MVFDLLAFRQMLNPLIIGKLQNMKLRNTLLVLIAAVLLALPACEQQPNANQKDGIKDALDTRPDEKMRDLGEDIEKKAKDVGSDLKDAVKRK